MLLQQSMEYVSIVYTCNTYFIHEYLFNVLIQYAVWL